MSLLEKVLSADDTPADIRQAALDRIHGDPGIPTANGSTKSFWMKDKHSGVGDVQSTALPQCTDVAIIGSGISGLSVAHTILRTRGQSSAPSTSVVMLEARDVCSGATGRNGGHLLESVTEYLEFKNKFGQKEAMKLIRFRLSHLPAMESLVNSSKNPALLELTQLRKVRFVSVYFEEEPWKDALENLAEFKKDMPQESKDFASHTGESLVKDFQLGPHAIGAITGPAGAVWPYRLVTETLSSLRRDFPKSFTLETNTPVSSIRVRASGEEKSKSHTYELTTPRGILLARHVVHCTNGHVGHLVPGFRGRLTPVRGQMSAQGAGERFKNQGANRSWLFNYSNGFDYVTQLPSGDARSNQEFMFGGGLSALPFGGVTEIGQASDDVLDLYADIHLSGTLSTAFGRDHWGSSVGVTHMWTGIMGFTIDGLPWRQRDGSGLQ
ncbi:hypothetical protein ACJ41O_005555 [Fusarium nematophilum]